MGQSFSRPPGCGCFKQRKKRWLEPSILFLLFDKAKHGYTLIAELPDLGFLSGPVDPGAVYRMLRHLEDYNLVQSEWDTSGSGPAKRLYTITPAGKQHLFSWRTILEDRRDAMQMFLNKVNKLEESS